MELAPRPNPGEPTSAVSLAGRILPLSRELVTAGLIDEVDKVALKELAFAHDPDLAYVMQESETNAASTKDVAESLQCLLRARRSADGRLHHLHHGSSVTRRGHFLHDLLVYHWENLTSVFWFRFWDGILVRVIFHLTRRYPFLVLFLRWLIEDPS